MDWFSNNAAYIYFVIMVGLCLSKAVLHFFCA